jgi:hypothetical protein
VSVDRRGEGVETHLFVNRPHAECADRGKARTCVCFWNGLKPAIEDAVDAWRGFLLQEVREPQPALRSSPPTARGEELVDLAHVVGGQHRLPKRSQLSNDLIAEPRDDERPHPRLVKEMLVEANGDGVT